MEKIMRRSIEREEEKKICSGASQNTIHLGLRSICLWLIKQLGDQRTPSPSAAL